MNFFAVIIGTEILNGRREDKHFEFLKNELLSRGWELKGSFIIKDEPQLMKNIFSMIRDYPNSVMFSFGGIGSTPDDYTRQIASEIFSENQMQINEEFRKKIEDKFSKKYDSKSMKHRVNMANLPKNSELLYDNPINGMCGFYLKNRFFFVPGFPEMAHSMVKEALDKFYSKNMKTIVSKTLSAKTTEGSLIEWMKSIPNEVEFSSLPKTNVDEVGNVNPTVTISLKSENSETVEKYFSILIEILNAQKIEFQIGESFDLN